MKTGLRPPEKAVNMPEKAVRTQSISYKNGSLLTGSTLSVLNYSE